MRIVFFYENAEINAMEDMANELNKKAGTAEEKVEMLREKLSMFSPYIKVKVEPMIDGGVMISADVSIAYLLDLCGVIKSHAQQVVDSVNAAMTMAKAFGAVSPMFSSLKDILSKAMDFKQQNSTDRKDIAA